MTTPPEVNVHPRIVLCVPGSWTNEADLGPHLVAQGWWQGEAGAWVDGDGRTIRLMDRDDRLPGAFLVANHGCHARPLADSDRDALAAHRSVAYVVGRVVERRRAWLEAVAMMGAADLLLQRGGHGVKCESSALAHSAAGWRELYAEARNGLCERREADSLEARARLFGSLFEAYVQLPLGHASGLRSCGMHLLGYRDAEIELESRTDASALVPVLGTFLCYQLIDRSEQYEATRDGEAFRVARDAVRWMVSGIADPGIEPFANPYGLWRLTRDPLDLAASP